MDSSLWRRKKCTPLLPSLFAYREYFKAKRQADLLQNDIELKEKEVYDLKHELIVSDSKAETATKELNEALEKIKSLEKEVIKLQTELEK